MRSRHCVFPHLLVVLLGATASLSVAVADTSLVSDSFNDNSRLNTPKDQLDADWVAFTPQVDQFPEVKPPTIGVHNDGAIEGATLRFKGTSAFAYGVATFPTASLSSIGNYIEIGFDFALDSAPGKKAGDTGPKLGLFHNNGTPLTSDNPGITESPTRDDRGYMLIFRRNFNGKLVLQYQDRTAESFRGGTTVGTWNPAQLPDTAAHHLTVRFTLAARANVIAVPTLDGFVGAPVSLDGADAVRSFNEVVVSSFTGGATGYIDNIYVKMKVLTRTFYYTTSGDSNTFGYGSFLWDGTNLSASGAQLGILANFSINGSLKVGADGLIYSGQGGAMYQMDPVLGSFRGVSSGVNNNVTSIDPAGTTVYAGWKDTPLATLATGDAFDTGTKHLLSGDDTVATGLAWDATGQPWYTTGGEDVTGNVGKIDLSTFTTRRALSEISATSIVFDPFTGNLFTAGVDGIAQIDPASGTVVSAWQHPQGPGLFIQNLDATGTGQLIAFDRGGLLRLWDFTSGSGLIGDASTVEAAVETSVFGGGLSLADVAGPPVIESPLIARAAEGIDFVYQFEATNAATLSISKLPEGLTFDASLSAIVGEPTVSGAYQVALTAANAFGTTNATLVLTIRPANSPGPLIISSTSATGRTNNPFRFQVISRGASGSATLQAAGLPPGLTFDAVTGVISGTPTVDGSSSVALTVTDGNNAAKATLQLTFTSDPALPVITSPSEATVVPNVPFNYTIVAPSTISDPGETVFRMIGDLPAGLGFDPDTGTISGTSGGFPRQSGKVAGAGPKGTSAPPPHSGGAGLSGGVITNVQLFATNSTGTSTLPLIFYLAPKGLVNIATRLSVGSGDNVLITGFILTGNAPKKVILRALGPSLKVGEVPLAGRLPDPTLDLYDGSTLLGSNDNWRSDQEDEILGTSIPPPDDREAAAVATLAAPGSYTAVVRGKNNSTGFGVVELYDLGTASLDTTSNAQLVNLSTRGLVQKGDNILIGGFIVSGEPTKVIVRAIGPSLNSSVTGALQDPTLSLVDGNGAVVKEDDNWRTGGQQQEIINSTVPPSDDRESAVVATLNPGGYTAVVRGSADTTGVAVVEVYVLK